MTTFTKSFPLVAENEIDQAATRLGIKLPADYRSFLLNQNGGKPSPNEFQMQISSPNNKGILTRLFGICKDDRYDLESVAKRYQGRVPKYLLAIGQDPGGNLICLAVSGVNANKIFFWEHEEEAEEGEPPTEKNLTLIANNFASFVAQLR